MVLRFEDPRFREKDGVYYPRVTWITSLWPKEYLNRYREELGTEEADIRKRKAAEEGTFIHQAMQDYFAGKPVPKKGLPLRIVQKLEGIQQFDEDFGFKILAGEKAFFAATNARRGAPEPAGLYRVLQYSGQVDLVGGLSSQPKQFRGPAISPAEVWVIDLKTGEGIYPEHDLQLTGYQCGLNLCLGPEERPVTRRGILHVRPGRTRHYSFKEVTDEDMSAEDWMDALSFFYLVHKNPAPKVWEFDDELKRKSRESG